MASPLIEALEAADATFGRPAVAAVYAEYENFLATGRYPYNDDVVRDITERHDVPGGGTHHPFTGLRKKLAHEVYLASGQHRLAKMCAEEAQQTLAGLRAITDLVPQEGARIRLQDTVYRCKAAGGDWLLLPPGKRTHGLSLSALAGRHRTFLEAKTAGNTRLGGAAVVMFGEVA